MTEICPDFMIDYMPSGPDGDEYPFDACWNWEHAEELHGYCPCKGDINRCPLRKKQ